MFRACFTILSTLFLQTYSGEPLQIHSACNDLSDGLRYIKSTQLSPVIPVICSNGYTMLTPALNLNTYLKYFKSLKLEKTSSFGVAHECQQCSSANIVAIDENDLWIASIHLDQSQCPCYKPIATETYTVFTHELPSVKSSKAASLSYDSYSVNIIFTEATATEENDINVGIPSSCYNLADGANFIMPSEDIGEIIHVNCHNGWVILNPELDPSVSTYFTSWLEYTDNVVGPSFDDFATWRQWLYSANQNTEFSLSPDCSACEEEDDSKYDKVYHMTGNYYLCAWGTKGDCDMDLNGECYSCVNRHGGNDYLEYMSGTCTHMINYADQKVYTHHDDCTGMSDNSKPSLGLNGNYCVCYRENLLVQSTRNKMQKIYTQFDYEIPVYDAVNTDGDIVNTVNTNIIHLCTDDFKDGTYRITESGTYVLDCDIEFEPNPPLLIDETDEPNWNDYNEYGWFPLPEQENEYETGFIDNSYVGEYQLGFIAAVTIECDNVVFDLNGHTIQQSKIFYLQQRFFSVFLLNNKNFIEGQGPVFFGAEMKTVNNVIIKGPGVIGRSSHHGVLARQTNNLLLEDITFNNFDVAGLSLSGFQDVILRNLDIGPNNQDCPVTGRYLHARAMLPRYKQLVEDHGSSYIQVNGEKKKIKTIIDRLVESMNIIYNKEILGYEYDENDELYQLSMLEFGNAERVSDGGVVYGILLNGYGGAVMGLGSAPRYASNVEMENINIHDFTLNPIEKCKFALSNSPFTVRGPFADVFDADVASYVDDDGFLHYVGTPFSDAQLAFARVTESWSALSHTDMGKRFQRWTSGELSLDYMNDVMWSCNTDIQLHVNKGPIGLRIDGITDAKLNNINIENLLNIGDLGDSDKCGPYLKGNGHQDSQVQLGYTGTDNYGLVIINSGNVVLENELNINNVESYNGISTGISILRDAVLTLSDTAKINIESIMAGTQLPINSLTFADLPNKIPIACPVNINLGAIEFTTDNSEVDDFVSIVQDTISGHAECLDTLHISKTELTNIPSACNSLPDGVQYILPYGLYEPDSYPLLPVLCSNGDTILDPSLSFERYSAYFSSFYMYDIGIAGPSLNDFRTWRQWFLPFENRDIKAVFEYGVSDDCSVCQYGNPNTDIDADYISTNNAYYMTGNFYLCAWVTKGDCDMDADTYQCFECARNGGRSDEVFPGVCSHILTNIDFMVHSDHYQCTGNNDNLKPSIGTNGQFCTCYKPQDNDLRTYQMNTLNFEQDILQLSVSQSASESQTEDNNGDENDIIYLSNADFLYGTYRIQQSGVYVLTEDISINFNAPSEDEKVSDDFSPNNFDDLYWMPLQDGSQDEQYMGSSTWSGPYQLGFFTAITIETDNVIIDLNGFEIGMSDEFYLQQRVFSIIELAAKNFVSGQGPVDFGPYLNSATNIVIKNGIIGKASHHGIHGNGATDITLSNLQIYNFDVAGIQLNGFDNVVIQDCEIGPSASDIPVTGRYLHARVLLRRYKHLVDEYGDESLAFYQRDSFTVAQYVDELVLQMDMVYNHVINGVEYEDIDYERWMKAQDLFINPNENGYGDGGVVYGILLNSKGGAVMGFGNAPSQSTNIVVNNVNIHDLAISPLEKLKFKTNELGGATRGPVADVFDVMKVVDQFEDIGSSVYIGTAFSDVQIIMSRFEKSWYVLDHTCFDEGVMNWVLNGVTFDTVGYYGGCNTDIQLHINKGVIGLRIDNIDTFTVSNVQITNLLNTGVLGTETDVCGAYTQGNAHQNPLITAGYTGTEGYGITITQSVNGNLQNININNIETHYGNANGIALFKDSSVNFVEQINIDQIIAGSHLQLQDLRPEWNYLPNKIPVACSIFNNNYNTQYTIDQTTNTQIIGTNINGFLVCSEDQLIGQCNEDSLCTAQYDQTYFDDLVQNAQLNKFAKTSKSHTITYLPKIIIILCILVIFISGCMFVYRTEHGMYKYQSLPTISNSCNSSETSENTPLLIH